VGACSYCFRRFIVADSSFYTVAYEVCFPMCVFLQVIEVRTPYKELNGGLNAGAYLQWRPVSYNNESRDVTSSTETIQYPPKMSNQTSEVENSMLYRYYSNMDELLLQRLIVSLGSKGDGFYKKTNYLTWWVIRLSLLALDFTAKLHFIPKITCLSHSLSLSL